MTLVRPGGNTGYDRRSFAVYVIARFTPWHHDGPVLRRYPHRFLCRVRSVHGPQFFSLQNVERKNLRVVMYESLYEAFIEISIKMKLSIRA